MKTNNLLGLVTEAELRNDEMGSESSGYCVFLCVRAPQTEAIHEDKNTVIQAESNKVTAGSI